MSGSHILTPDWISEAEIECDSEFSSALSIQNLFMVQQSFYYQSDGLGLISIIVDASVAKPWDGLALLYHNGYTGTVHVTSGNSYANIFSAPDYDHTAKSLVFPGDLSKFTHRHTWIKLDSVQTHRYIGIRINDPTNPDGHFRAGVLAIGTVFTPRFGAAIGSKKGYHDLSHSTRLRSGESISIPKKKKLIGSWSFPKQPLEDRIKWENINMVYGSSIPIVFKWDPWGPDPTLYQQYDLYYGKAQWPSGGAFTYANAGEGIGGLWDVDFGMEEL
jgi:hypothetical protein